MTEDGRGRTADSPLLSLARLLQLASPALPIGAFSYSQGLERVIEDGVIRDAATAEAWIGDLLDLVVAPGEAALLARMTECALRDDAAGLAHWNCRHRASRETAELRAETEQTGGSLVRLLSDLGLLDAFAFGVLPGLAPVTLPAAWALAARAFALDAGATTAAYCWTWLENQVMAAVKAVPLGQTAGQRMLLSLAARIPAATSIARSIDDDDIATFAPGLALASSRHETQYTRLFRS